MNKFKFLIVISLISEILLSNQAWSGDSRVCAGAINTPVADNPAWVGRPFDLVYDGNWVVNKGSFADLNREDELLIISEGDYYDNKMQGLRFTTGSDWEKFASGKIVKVTIEAKSSSQSNILFKVAYLTNEVGFSGWREAVAGKYFSSFSFDYKIGKMKKGNNDFIMVFPNSPSNKHGILIRKATLEVKP